MMADSSFGFSSAEIGGAEVDIRRQTIMENWSEVFMVVRLEDVE